MWNSRIPCTVALAAMLSGPVVSCDGSAFTEPADASALSEASSLVVDAGVGAAIDEESIDAAASCDALQDAALNQFGTILQQNLACNQDTDCVETALPESDWCVSHCGVLTSQAGVAPVTRAADDLCKPFSSNGCSVLGSSCLVDHYLCAGGVCATYSFNVTPNFPNNMTHGASCAALQIGYLPHAGAPNAPHDLTVPISASNATLFSDSECNVPLTTSVLTIDAGTSTLTFGMMPTAAGAGSLIAGGVTYSFTAL